MLLELLSKLFHPKSKDESTQTSSEQSELSVSWQAPSLGLSNNPNWMTKAVDQLRRHEGEVLHAYTDSLGMLTIGVGRLIDKRKGGGISKEESEMLLSNDVNKVVSELNTRLPWFNTLSDPRKAVLINMGFQLGIAGLMGFSKTLSLIESGQYAQAADQMLQSKWATQTPKRAVEMSEQMRTGQWVSG